MPQAQTFMPGDACGNGSVEKACLWYARARMFARNTEEAVVAALHIPSPPA